MQISFLFCLSGSHYHYGKMHPMKIERKFSSSHSQVHYRPKLPLETHQQVRSAPSLAFLPFYLWIFFCVFQIGLVAKLFSSSSTVVRNHIFTLLRDNLTANNYLHANICSICLCDSFEDSNFGVQMELFLNIFDDIRNACTFSALINVDALTGVIFSTFFCKNGYWENIKYLYRILKKMVCSSYRPDYFIFTW